jgi:hypothetical protein
LGVIVDREENKREREREQVVRLIIQHKIPGNQKKKNLSDVPLALDVQRDGVEVLLAFRDVRAALPTADELALQRPAPDALQEVHLWRSLQPLVQLRKEISLGRE